MSATVRTCAGSRPNGAVSVRLCAHNLHDYDSFVDSCKALGVSDRSPAL